MISTWFQGGQIAWLEGQGSTGSCLSTQSGAQGGPVAGYYSRLPFAQNLAPVCALICSDRCLLKAIVCSM